MKQRYLNASRAGHKPGRAIAAAKPAHAPILAMLAGLLFLATAMALAIGFAPGAHAQVLNSTPYVAPPDPAVEELRHRIEALEAALRKATDRTEVLGAQLSDAKRAADDANAGRKKVEADLAALTTRVEALEDMVKDAKDAAAATGNVQAASATVNLTGGGTPGAAAAAVDVAQLPGDEEGLFTQAHDLLLSANYPGAQTAFTTYISKFPKGKQIADAQYFLGESLLYQDNYPDAAAAYGKMIKTYPDSPNGPNALVKLSRALRLMDKPGDACKTLDLMAKQFPKASAAAKQMASTERQRAGCKA